MARWTATLTLDGATTRLVSVDHDERVGEVPTTRCVAMLAGDPPVLSELVGKPASVVVEDADLGTSRAIAGIVVDVALTDLGVIAGRPAQRLDLAIAPRLARLDLRADCRSFQDLSAEDIAREVLEGAGYTADEITAQLGEPPPPRAWVVQYEETDLHFLQRLLAEEGIALAVQTDGEVDTVVLYDGDLGPASPERLRFDTASGMDVQADAVSDLTITSEPRPGKVTLRDYDFEKPRLGLEVVEEADRDGDFEVFDVPGRYADEDAGKRRARLRLEGLRCGRNRVTGTSTALGLAVGSTVKLEGHPYEALNAEIQVTALRASA